MLYFPSKLIEICLEISLFLQFWGFEPKDLTLRTNAQYKIIEHLNVLKISPKCEA